MRSGSSPFPREPQREQVLADAFGRLYCAIDVGGALELEERLLAFLGLMVTPLIATMPHRQGLALAIDYLSRVYMPDPSDEIRGAKA